jgi:hypothetical protein
VGKYSASKLKKGPASFIAANCSGRVATVKMCDESADDWLQTLFVKRRQGRRILPDALPPYSTQEGMVLIDRRSQCDRRKALDQKLPAISAAS